MNIKELIEEIDAVREILHDVISKKEQLFDKEAVELSQKLDDLIVLYTKMTKEFGNDSRGIV